MHSYEKHKVVSCYNLTARKYADKFVAELDEKPFDRFILDRFAKAIPPSETTYEMGCGPGQIARYLHHNHGLAITGLDDSVEMIRTAEKLHPMIPFVVGDMLNLDLPSNSVFGIVAFYSIVHFTLKEVAQALDEFYRVLKPGGIILFSYHVGNEIISINDFLETEGASTDWVFFETDDIVQIIKDKGITIEDVVTRYPYEGKEHGSRRCYTILRK